MSTATMDRPQAANSLEQQQVTLSAEEVRLFQEMRARRKKSPIERIRENCPPGMSIRPPMEFELLAGNCVEADLETGEDRHYSAGDGRTIKTYNDLTKFNVDGYPPKFRRIDTGAPDGAALNPYAPIPGETREAYQARLAEQTSKYLQQFDSMTLLSATPGNQAPTTAQAQAAQNAPPAPPQKPIERMTEGELRKLAADEGLDLAKFKGNRDALLETIRKQLSI